MVWEARTPDSKATTKVPTLPTQVTSTAWDNKALEEVSAAQEAVLVAAWIEATEAASRTAAASTTEAEAATT